MRILAVSVGQPVTIEHMGKEVPTAIFKSQVKGPVVVRATGVEGDQQANLEAHGGPDKTVHAFPFENYPFYQSRYGEEEYPHGFFGENFTTIGLTEDQLHIGDRLRVGQALFEVTMPRMPCFKFGIKLGNSTALKDCISSGRTGYYLRVLKEGLVAAGDDIILENLDTDAPTVHEVHDLRFHAKQDWNGMSKALRVSALSGVIRREFEDRLKDTKRPSGSEQKTR